MSIFTCDNKDEFIFDMFGKTKSYFVDVGASDGIYGSNTYSLEKRGWEGLCVEAHPDLVTELGKNRSCKIEPSLVGKEKENVVFALQLEECHAKGFVVGNTYGGFSHSWRGGSRIVENRKEKTFISKGEMIEMQTTPLTEILDKHNSPTYIELLDIDTEGNDYNVLEGINWNKYRFASILIEGEGDEDKIKQKLEALDYVMVQKFAQEHLYIDSKKKGLVENVKNIQNIGYWSQRIFGETCL